jgi:hypothetical protein
MYFTITGCYLAPYYYKSVRQLVSLQVHYKQRTHNTEILLIHVHWQGSCPAATAPAHSPKLAFILIYAKLNKLVRKSFPSVLSWSLVTSAGRSTSRCKVGLSVSTWLSDDAEAEASFWSPRRCHQTVSNPPFWFTYSTISLMDLR